MLYQQQRRRTESVSEFPCIASDSSLRCERSWRSVVLAWKKKKNWYWIIFLISLVRLSIGKKKKSEFGKSCSENCLLVEKQRLYRLRWGMWKTENSSWVQISGIEKKIQQREDNRIKSRSHESEEEFSICERIIRVKLNYSLHNSRTKQQLHTRWISNCRLESVLECSARWRARPNPSAKSIEIFCSTTRPDPSNLHCVNMQSMLRKNEETEYESSEIKNSARVLSS